MPISSYLRVNLALVVLVVLASLPAPGGADPQTAPVPAQNEPAKAPQTTGVDAAKQRNQSDESFVIEQLTCEVAFADDGTGQREESARIRIQSEGGIQQFGVLTFPYSNDIERIETIQIQVRKPDGRIVTTPESNIQDLSAQVTREAPTYSDLREKQAPVKSLGIGDVLEWRTRTVRTKAIVPGQFWFTYYFAKDGPVLEELLRITVPAAKYAKVSSPGLTPEVHEDNGRKVYQWKKSHAESLKEDETKKAPQLHPRPDVQLTTFKSWQEVGQWYDGLQESRIAVTPALREKAVELVRDLTTNLEKQRAIYQFVATKFRYVSISFGNGRYQPHSAEEALANQYGDCKDKHTLFAALLKAAGIEAWPALIGAGLELDPDVPSPAQFNHVITFIPEGKSGTWLDTTAEVAPYGWLAPSVRDRQALVIPENGAPSLMVTAKESPFPADTEIVMESKLSVDGTLTGHFDLSSRGDEEVVLRSLFHQTAAAQWTTLAQGIAASMGYGGTVRGLDADSPTGLDQPFHYSYNYDRKNYSDWPNRRITPPIPPFGLIPSQEADRPSEPVDFGARGQSVNRATVELPNGYSAELPGDVKLRTEFADYSASYLLDKGVLSAERVLVVKSSKLAVSQWDAYKEFAKAVVADESGYIQLVRAGAVSGAGNTRDVPEAAELVQRAWQAIQTRDVNAVRDALAQAERVNDRQSNLWWAYGALYQLEGQNDKSTDALKKEIQYHPGNEQIYRVLAASQRRLGHNNEAIDTLRQLVNLAPQNVDGVLELTAALFEAQKYAEAIEPLQVALKAAPDNARVEMPLVEAQLRGGRKAPGLAALAKMREGTLDAFTLNSAAWVLADTSTEPALAKELAERAVKEYESQLKEVTLSSLTADHLKLVDSLGGTWDTLGWAAFRLGDLGTAERYIHAAWMLDQHAAQADHLGQIYERLGKTREAIHAYQLALAVNRNLPETRFRLQKIGGSVEDSKTYNAGTPTRPIWISAEGELSELRTWRVPELKYQHGTAEFYLLLSKAGTDELQFIRGDEELKPATGALGKVDYKMSFPDDGPEKIARRGILSCSQVTTPSCTFVLFLAANTTK